MNGFDDPFITQKLLLADAKAPVIIDGGAHVGSTVVNYRKHFPDGFIYSFEPYKASAEKFMKNITEMTNLELIKLGLAEKTCSRKFYINGYDPTNSIFPRPKTIQYYPENASTINTKSIKCISLDDFISQRELTKVDILKLDVQGAELLVLQGASDALSNNLFKVLFIETSFVPLYEGGALYYDVASYLAKYEYSLYRMYDFEYALDGQIKFCNSIFITDELRNIMNVRYKQTQLSTI